jgi:hypothetical protein
MLQNEKDLSMKKKLLAIASLVLVLPLCNHALAQSNKPMESGQTLSSRFYIGAYQGYGVVNNMLHNDGQSALGRLMFGYKAYSYEWENRDGSIGLELGLQNGKTMRHSPASNDPTGGVDLPIQTTHNPVLDLLAAFNKQFTPCYGYFGMLKAGIAYRQLQFPGGNYVSSINQVSPEFQVGVGYMLTKSTRVVIYYQGIYADGHVSYRAHPDTLISVSNIPTQQAGFLGFETAI